MCSKLKKKKKKWIITQRKYLQLWLNIFITCEYEMTIIYDYEMRLLPAQI